MNVYCDTYLRLAGIKLQDFEVYLFIRNSVKLQHKTELGHLRWQGAEERAHRSSALSTTLTMPLKF